MTGNATIGSLKVDLGLNSAEFQTRLKAATGGLSDFAKSANVAGLAIGAALAGAGAAVGAAIKAAIDNADELSKAAQRVGVPIQELQRLKYAADLAGVSMEALSNGLKRMSFNIAKVAAGGGGPAAQAFEALGLSVRDAEGNLKNAGQIVDELAGKFGPMADSAGKTALAIAIFGKQGADLIPLLNEGSVGLAKLKDEADALGIVLSQETATAAEELNDNISRLKTVGQGLASQLAAAVLPAMASVAEAMVGLAKNTEIMRGVGTLLGGTLRVLATTGVVLGAVFKAAGTVLSGVTRAIMATVKGDFGGAIDALNTKVYDLGPAFGAIKTIWSDVGSKVAASSGAVSDGLVAPMLKGAEKAAKAGKAIRDEAEKAAESTARYVAQLEREVDEVGLTSNALKRLAADREIEAALKRGDTASAMRIRDLVFEREKLEDLADGLKEAAEARKEFQAGQVQLLTTPGKLAAAISTASSKMTRDLSKVMASFLDIRSTMDSVFRDIKNQDWASAFSGLIIAADKVAAAFKKGASAADKVSAIAGIADAAGNAIGGRGGKAISSAANAGATAFQATGNPYVAAAAAVVAGLSKILGPKPTNAGAGFDLRTGQVTGDKRTSETEGAAVSAGRAVQDAVALLKSTGVQFTDSLNALVLGTRDQSYLYFESGKVLRSAVGDSAAAVNTTLRALLETATFSSEMQRKVAQAALAAGKTFDEVIRELANLDAAQGITKSIADQILQLTDPKAFDISAVKADIAEQRKGAQAAADAGYLTADQLAAINAQLSKLEGLRLDEVLAKYGEGAVSSAQAQADAASAVAAAQQDLAALYEGQIGDLETVRDRLADVAESLADFGRELDSSDVGGLTPAQQLAAAQKAFDAVKGKTDADSLAQIPELGRSLIEAQRAAAPNARALAATQAEVRRVTEAATAAALQQVSAADAQIAALRAEIEALGVNTAAQLTVATAQSNLSLAMANYAAVQAQSSAALQAAVGSLSTSVQQASAMVAANLNTPPPAFTAAGVNLAGDISAELVPVLISIARTNGQLAELAQLARDEADAA